MKIISTRTSIGITCLAALALAACGDDETTPNADEPVPQPSTTASADPSSTTEAQPDTTPPAPTTSPTTTVATSAATTAPGPDEATSTTTEPATETTMPAPVPDDVAGSSMVQFAISDLRDRLGDAGAEITVVSVEEVDWPDGSLGCPQPGMVYTQAIVNGSKIVLSHAGINYDYHQGGGRDPFYCAPGTSVDK